MTICDKCGDEYIADLWMSTDYKENKCLVCRGLTIEPDQLHGKKYLV